MRLKFVFICCFFLCCFVSAAAAAQTKYNCKPYGWHKLSSTKLIQLSFIFCLHCHWSRSKFAARLTVLHKNHVFIAATRFMSAHFFKQTNNLLFAMRYLQEKSKSCEMEINKSCSDGNTSERERDAGKEERDWKLVIYDGASSDGGELYAV